MSIAAVTRASVLSLIVLCATTQATTIYVTTTGNDASDGLTWSTAKKTVQAGLNTAQSGDQVWVAAGTYVENITLALGVELYGGFTGTETDSAQRNWVTNKTILDGNQAGSVVTGPTGATSATRIDGFMITNGSGTGSDPIMYGGGLYLAGSSPTIANNTITGNNAFGGGGLYLSSSSSVVISNTITNNSAEACGNGLFLVDSSPTVTNNNISDNRGGTWGGGLHLSGSSGRIAYNRITGNSADGGGGFYLASSSSPMIDGNTISGNGGSAGGGLFIDYSSPTITNNVIAANAGGGLYLELSSSTIVNNTIVGNSGSPDRGGLYLDYYSSPTITNTIIAFNSSGIYRDGSSSAPVLRNNCVYGNMAYNYSGLADCTGTNGNISIDPNLAGTAYGNYHIQSGSRCKDAGNDADVEMTWQDVDGQPRIIGDHVDIGADESDDTAWPAGPYVIVRVSATGNDANDGSSWALAKRTVQAGIDAASALSGEVWVAGGIYRERITLQPYAHIYGGFTGTETRRDQRNWRANVTILDGSQDGSVVTARNIGIGSSTFDGFTIRNGKAYTGGVYLYLSSPTIANNFITGNSDSGLYLYCSAAAITNNTIICNSSSIDGAGVRMYYSCPTITNNTIAYNSTSSDVGSLYSASDGGGLYFASDSSPTIINTLIAYNSSGICRNSEPFDSGGSATLRGNCVYGNIAYDYSGLSDPAGTDGNINADPRLADPAHCNYHIQADSPCKDAGSDPDAQTVSVDMDGQARILGSHVDIGADESDGTIWMPAADTIVRVSPAGDDANDGSSWCLAKRTVQAGIDAASAAGGQVWVAKGIYYEQITLKSFAHIYGGFAGTETQQDQRDWRINVTVLDGSQSGSVVTGTGMVAGSSTLDGFTIRNGNATYGGGLHLQWASPVVAHNTITGNSASSCGGGLYLFHSSAKILANAILGNAFIGGSTPDTLGQGAGLYLYDSSAIISDNTITGNNAAQGGGLYVADSLSLVTGNTITDNSANSGAGLCLTGRSPTIANNRIAGNSASGAGGGLSVSECSATITSNRIECNSALSGGGLYAYSSSSTISGNSILNNWAMSGAGAFINSSSTISNNVIAQNSSSSGGGLYLAGLAPMISNNTITANSAITNGGALFLSNASSPTIANTIIAFNSSGVYQSGTMPTPTFRSNCVYGNNVYDYSGLNDPTGTNSNINADPMLADVAHCNFHIQPNSPCMNAGNDGDVQIGWLDIDGQPRQIGQVDIGADESDGTTWAPAQDIIVRVSPSGDDANDGSSWVVTKKTVQAGIDAASAAAGGEVWVASGTYYERITLRPCAHIYGGFVGNEIQRNQRDWRANVTILDGQQGGSVVTGNGIASGLSTLDGFTVCNGKANAGAGVYLSYSSPAITNSIITSNSAVTCGGGLCLSHSSPIVANNTISGNSGSVYGGGVYLSYSSPMITNNAITSNNVSSRGALGGGLYVSYSSATIANNRIAGNSCSACGGGLYVEVCSPTIENNTIIANNASSGGGLCLASSYPTISRTIVAFNSSGIYLSARSGSPTLRHDCVYGNTAYNYSGLTDPTGTTGNISNDPLFVQTPAPGTDGKWGTADDILGDVHLQFGSPCINTGDPTYVPAGGETDMDGQLRIIGSCIDIGVDEYRLPGDVDYDGKVILADLKLLMPAWNSTPDRPNWNPAADLDADGGVTLSDLKILVANWNRAL